MVILKMKEAKDHIIFPLDVPDLEAAKPFISLLSSHVGMFKVGLELFIRSGPEVVRYIRSESGARIFLDLKLHDIPVTVKRAMQSVAELGVDLATVHCGESQAMLEAAMEGSGGKVNVLGVTVLTSVSAKDIESAGFQDSYVSNIADLVIKRAILAKASGLNGIVCSGLEVEKIKEVCGDDFLCVTPGIRPAFEVVKGDDQQRVCTPAQAITRGADYLVIGRPIRDAKDPKAAAMKIAEEIEDGRKG
jgi:orotidine-5'-phosphate decarboxylase